MISNKEDRKDKKVGFGASQSSFFKQCPMATGILILANLGATTESCRVASTNPVNIYGLLGFLRVVGAYMRSLCPPLKISFS
jgi:hypothetical protein